MRLVIIFGPSAVGKMTVGNELARLCDFTLFHNHMSIELVHQFFDFGTAEFERLDEEIRFAIFREVSKSKLNGLIFTLVWNFDDPGDMEYVMRIQRIFRDAGAAVSFVELQASLETRLTRNTGEDRLVAKPTKRDLARSSNYVRESESKFRMHTRQGELNESSLLRVDTTQMSAREAAAEVIRYFDF